MKVNITGIRGIPAKHGGFETFAEALSDYLRHNNWDVTVYCQTDGWGCFYTDTYNGVRRINIPIPFGGPMATIVFDLLSTLHVCFISRSLTLVLGYNTAIFSIFYRLFAITSIMNMDGIEWQRNKWGRVAKCWFKLNEWLGCKLSNHLIADHSEIAKHLITRHGTLPITTIPYGANAITAAPITQLQNYKLAAGDYYLVIARPEPENSIVEIVRGFVGSKSKKKLVLLGDYKPSAPYQAEVLNAADHRVVFLGAIYDRAIVTVLRYYAAAYIHGHTVGGTNPSLVEAMGATSAIIAHDNRFNRGVCADTAVYFHDSSDLSKLIDGTDTDSLQELKQKVYTRFKDSYTLETVHQKYADVLEKFSR